MRYDNYKLSDIYRRFITEKVKVVIAWILVAIFLILFWYGIAVLVMFAFKGSPVEPQLLPSTTTTTMVGRVGDKNDPEIGDAANGGGTCLRIGSADSDPTLYNLEWVGYDVEYESNLFYINDIEIGSAVAEDEPFLACGPSWLINTMDMFQKDAIAAGAEPVFGE